MSEHIYDLGCKGYKIIQDKLGYAFTTDSVLLANFVKLGYSDEAIELCSGSGVISVLAYAKNGPKKIVGVEIEERLCDMANRTSEINGLVGKVDFVNISLQEAPNYFKKEFAAVICNPPYNKNNQQNLSAEVAAARHEVKMSLEELMISTAKLLKFGGKFYLIHRADRIDEIFVTLMKYNLNPKVLQIVQPKKDKEAHLIMIEAVKGAKFGVRVRAPIVIDEM
ncbi:MAG: methyltransferase [Christensenellaceae bacterium]|jgi:tRNA1Val (adenine37-N6)-methyltransferase|nr:methyltransferase [Christensenellaceae bacterium]